MVRFSQSFWDKDPNGTTGYEALTKRLKDGRKLCDTISEFLKQRSKAEDDYGKTLIRIAQQASGFEEMGSLGEAWNSLRRETESMGTSHCEVGRKLDELDRKVKGFRDDQRNETAKLDNKMKKLQKDKKIAYDNVIKAKRQYELRCKELDSAVESLEAIATFTPKEEEKLKAKKARAKTVQENADRQYQSSVKTLEQTHEAWEQEMVVTCDIFQEMEESRVRFLRNEMWLYSNIASQSCVDNDALCETVRQQLEKCDDRRDITTFIHNKQTGSERPVPLKYENFYSPPSDSNYAAMEENIQSKALSLGRNMKLRPGAVYNSPADQGPLEKVRNSSPMTFVVLYDYNSQGDEELTLKKGDVIELIEYEDEEWGRGRLRHNGKVGVFHKTYVRKL